MVTAQLQGTLLILYQKKKKSFSLLFGFPDGCIHFLRDYLLGQFCCHLWMTFSLTCNSLGGSQKPTTASASRQNSPRTVHELLSASPLLCVSVGGAGVSKYKPGHPDS